TNPMNVLKQPYPVHTVAAKMLEVCKGAWSSVFSAPSMDNVILASVLTLVENHLLFSELKKMLLDKVFRESLVARVTDPLVGGFFLGRFDSKASQIADSTLGRAFLLAFGPVLRNAFGHQNNKLEMRHMISCIFNLGGLGEYTRGFLGCLLMA